MGRYTGSILRVTLGLGGIGLLAVATDWPTVALLTVAVSFVLAEGYLVVERRLDPNRGWIKYLAGSGVVAVGGVTIAGPGSALAGGLFVAAGAWLAADGAHDLRDGDLAVWHVDSLQYYRDLRAVRRALAERPREIGELADLLNMPVERVEAAVAVLRRRGRVEATPVGYRTTDAGPLGGIGPALRQTARRLARPLGL